MNKTIDLTQKVSDNITVEQYIIARAEHILNSLEILNEAFELQNSKYDEQYVDITRQTLGILEHLGLKFKEA